MKKDKPKFSIITVCFNGGSDLEKTIESVKAQNSKNYEYIVIDGGSKDSTKDILKKNDQFITYWVSEPDKGIYNAMNKGAAVVKGEYMYFLNAGDVFFDQEVLSNVEKQLESADLAYGQIRVVNKINDKSFIRDKTLTKENLKMGTKVSQQAVFIKTDIFKEVGGLNEKYRIASDFDLLSKVFENDYSVRKMNLVVCDYDRDGLSSNLKKSYGDTAKIIRDNYGYLWFLLYKGISYIKLIASYFVK